MAIKFAVLRTHDGHATDPTLPNATVRPGTRGYFEVLADGKTDGFRVTVGHRKAVEGQVLTWPDDLKAGKHKVKIEQIAGGKTIDTKEGEVTVEGAIVDEPEATPVAVKSAN